MAKRIKESEEKLTTWFNDNDVPAKFEVCDKVGDMLEIIIKPGESKTLPSYFDNAIQHFDKKYNMVMGGLCPWLKKVNSDGSFVDLRLHDSLDYKKVLEEKELMMLAELIEKKDRLSRAAEVQSKKKKV